jgi:hypothetical protein
MKRDDHRSAFSLRQHLRFFFAPHVYLLQIQPETDKPPVRSVSDPRSPAPTNKGKEKRNRHQHIPHLSSTSFSGRHEEWTAYYSTLQLLLDGLHIQTGNE